MSRASCRFILRKEMFNGTDFEACTFLSSGACPDQEIHHIVVFQDEAVVLSALEVPKGENEMGILSWIFVGLIAGWLAGQVMKGGGYGVLGDIVLGILGAVVGGFLASALFSVPDPLTGFNLYTLVVALIGSIIVIGIVRALPGRSPI